jgi:hypothetical protein
MNRIIMLVAAMAIAPAASAQLYKYVDKDGKTVYTDTPPAGAESKSLRAPAPAPAPATKPAVESKEPPKATRDTRAAAPKPEPAAMTAEQKEARCQAARADYVIFLDGGPVVMRNTATGERFTLDEKQAEAEKAKAKAAMDEACKKT